MKDAVTVAVHRDGDALGLGEGVEDQEVAMRIFLVPKRGGGDFTGRVIHGRDEREAWPALFEPSVVAAIELHEQAFLGHALPAPAVTGWAAPAGAAHPGRPENATQRGAREGDPLALAEQLRKMLVVHVSVGRGRERHDPGPDVVGNPVRREPPSVPMDERGRPAGAIGSAQPADVANRPPQEVGCLGHEKFPSVEGMEDLQVLLGTVRQCDHASPYSARSGGRTFSLTTLGRTESLTIYTRVSCA